MEEVFKILEEKPKSWRPGLAEELVQEHHRPSRPPPPWPPSETPPSTHSSIQTIEEVEKMQLDEPAWSPPTPAGRPCSDRPLADPPKPPSASGPAAQGRAYTLSAARTA